MNYLIWYAGLYAGSAAVLKLIGFALFMWLARSVSVEEYATFGLFYALQTGITTFSIAGIIEAVVGLLKSHHSSGDRERLFGAANSTLVVMGLPVSLVVVVGYASYYRGFTDDFPLLIYALMLGLLTAFVNLQAQLVRLNESHLASLALSFLAPLIGLLGGGAGFLLRGTVEWFFLGSTTALFLALAALWAARVGAYYLVVRARGLVPIFARIVPFIAVAFLGWLSGYGNNYFVKVFFEPIEIARFTFAYTLSGIMQLIATALNQVWTPRFYRIVHELPIDEIEKKNRRFFRVQGLILGLAAAAVILVFPIVTDLVGGNLAAYEAMTLELLLLFSGYIVMSPWWHCHIYYLAHGEGPELMRIVLVTSLIGVPAWVLLMWVLGPQGIYIGFLVQMSLRALGIVVAAGKRWPVTIAWEGVCGGLALAFGGFLLALT